MQMEKLIDDRRKHDVQHIFNHHGFFHYGNKKRIFAIFQQWLIWNKKLWFGATSRQE